MIREHALGMHLCQNAVTFTPATWSERGQFLESTKRTDPAIYFLVTWTKPKAITASTYVSINVL